MVQQDNTPNLETTVDGRPLFGGKKPQGRPVTKEYVAGTDRDDDPLLSESERANTQADIEQTSVDGAGRGMSHP